MAGSVRALRRALMNGAYCSVNPAMVRSERALALLAEVPRERVLTETDGPFVEARGAPATPRDVLEIIAGLAGLWAVSPLQARSVAYENFARIIRTRDARATSREHAGGMLRLGGR